MHVSVRALPSHHIHTLLATHRFWSWGLDELAKEDLPAVVAYILVTTGAKKVCHRKEDVRT